MPAFCRGQHCSGHAAGDSARTMVRKATGALALRGLPKVRAWTVRAVCDQLRQANLVCYRVDRKRQLIVKGVDIDNSLAVGRKGCDLRVGAEAIGKRCPVGCASLAALGQLR